MAIADCYADDLLGVLGFATVNMIDYPPTQALVHLSVWTLLIGIQSFCLFELWRSSGPRGRFGLIGYGLVGCSCALMVANHAIRLWVAVVRPVGRLLNVPAALFVESYVERLFIYALLASSAACSMMIVTRRVRDRRAIASLICMLLPAAIVFSLLALAGYKTLSGSGYWRGESIAHGPVYMGSIPRDLALSLEPYLTFAFVIGLGSFLGLLAQRGDLWRTSFVALSLVILVQPVPRLGRGLLTEAISATDFHYTFHHDRSITFPSLPFMVMAWTWFALQLFGSGQPGVGRAYRLTRPRT